VVLIKEGVLVEGVRGVTFVINVLGSGGVDFVGVVMSPPPPLVSDSVDRAVEVEAVEITDAELGVNFESGRGPDGISGFFDSGVVGA
jgi:hypothetical protein